MAGSLQPIIAHLFPFTDNVAGTFFKKLINDYIDPDKVSYGNNSKSPLELGFVESVFIEWNLDKYAYIF